MDETDETDETATRSCDPGRRVVRLAPITDVRRRAQAERDFKLWHDRGLRCLETFSYLLERGHLRHAAFDLFQATEAFYGALLLAFVGDKPWTHDLRMLRRTAARCDPLLAHVFPEASSEDERLFDLLNAAWMGARYDAEFRVTVEDLHCLHQRVSLLEALTDRLCRAKLATL